MLRNFTYYFWFLIFKKIFQYFSPDSGYELRQRSLLTKEEQHGLLPLALRRPSAAIGEFLSLTQALGLSLQAAWVSVISTITGITVGCG